VSRILLRAFVRAPAERCFDLARDVSAHTRSLAETGERVVAASHALLELGDEVTWEARHLGVRQRLTTRITEMEPPRTFTDEQVRGAFAALHHVHRFIQVDGGTEVVDDFAYRLPLGPLGRLADILVVRGHMRRLLATRGAYLKRLAESDPSSE